MPLTGDHFFSEEAQAVQREFEKRNILRFVEHSAEKTPEMNAFFLRVLSNIEGGGGMWEGIHLPETAKIGSELGVGAIDGLSHIMAGGALLLQYDQLYQQKQTLVKAGLLIFTGAQLSAFSYTPWIVEASRHALESSVALAAPAAAAAAAVELGLAAIDFHYALKETSFSGWLDERVDEWNFLQTQINEAEEKLKTKGEHDFSLHVELTKKISAYKLRALKLAEDIQARCWANTNAKETYALPDEEEQKAKDENAFLDIKNKLAEMKDFTAKTEEYLNFKEEDVKKNTSLSVSSHRLLELRDHKHKAIDYLKEFNSVYLDNTNRLDRNVTAYAGRVKTMQTKEFIAKRENEIKNNVEDRYFKSKIQLTVKTISFIGTSCLALAMIPGPQSAVLLAAGTVICSAVAIYTIFKHRKLASHAVKAAKAAVKQDTSEELFKRGWQRIDESMRKIREEIKRIEFSSVRETKEAKKTEYVAKLDKNKKLLFKALLQGVEMLTTYHDLALKNVMKAMIFENLLANYPYALSLGDQGEVGQLRWSLEQRLDHMKMDSSVRENLRTTLLSGLDRAIVAHNQKHRETEGERIKDGDSDSESIAIKGPGRS